MTRIFRGCPGTEAPTGWDREPKPTAFLDRDGVLNVDHGYVSEIENFEWINGAITAMENLKAAGFRVVVATNQSGIGRGLYTEDQFLRLSHWMLSQSVIDAICYCPHAPEADCPARKPGTSMFETVDLHLGVDRNRSFFVGDKDSDMVAADRFGIKGYRFSSGNLDEFLADIAL